jgi:hypothetical protein
MKSKKDKIKIFLTIMVIILMIISTSLCLYYISNKRIWLGLDPTGLLNNTVNIDVNNIPTFNYYIDIGTIETKPPGIGFITQVSGISIILSIRCQPINKSANMTFNLIQGSYFSIFFEDGTFNFRQSISQSVTY